MKAGDRFDKKIREALDRMDVFVCLVSYEFLASSYIQKVELKRAFTRQKAGEVEIVPIVLFPMTLEKDHKKLSQFNPLPAWGESWLDYEVQKGHYQAAHKLIRDGLRQAIEKVIARL